MFKIHDEKFFEICDMYDALSDFEHHRKANDDWRYFSIENIERYPDLVFAEDEDVYYTVEVLPDGIMDSIDLDAQELDYKAGLHTEADLSPDAHLTLRVVGYDQHSNEPLEHYNVETPEDIIGVIRDFLVNVIENV